MRIFTKGAIASSISSAAFDPADITGYELDLLASSLDGTYNDGDEATSWPDETGTYTYTVGDGSPTFKTSILNGESIVRYAGSASDRHQETSPTIAWGQKYSFVYVIKETTGTGNSVQIARDQSNSPWVAFVNSSDDIHVQAKNGSQTYQVTFTPSPARGNWRVLIWTVDFSTGDLKVYLNSDSVTSSTTGTTGSAPSASWMFFPTAASYPDCDIARFIIYNGHVLTGTEIADLNDYFLTEYGITHTT